MKILGVKIETNHERQSVVRHGCCFFFDTCRLIQSFSTLLGIITRQLL